MKHPLMSFLVLASVVVSACDSSHRNIADRNKPIVGAAVPGATEYAKVDSIFKKHCVTCHSGSDPADDLDLTTYEGLIKGTSPHTSGQCRARILPRLSALYILA